MSSDSYVARHQSRRSSSGGTGLTRALGIIGELLLTAGALLILFLVWQLWYTSIAAVSEGKSLVEDFYNDPAIVDAPRVPVTNAELRTDEPPVSEINGDMIGTLIVPKWESHTLNNMAIMEGTTPGVLDRAVAGHYVDTAGPGELGNFSLAGHRRSYGNSFRYVNMLEPGDQIIVSTATTWYVYEVEYDHIVLPSQVEVIAPVPGQPGVEPTERYLTLTTCHSLSMGEFGNSHRWITHAKFIGWMDRADGMPEQVVNDPGVQ